MLLEIQHFLQHQKDFDLANEEPKVKNIYVVKHTIYYKDKLVQILLAKRNHKGGIGF